MKQTLSATLLLAFSLVLATCDSRSDVVPNVRSEAAIPKNSATAIEKRTIQNPGRLIHVVVALCDNEYQGIVPVSASLGNGDDPASNLYWGAAFGVKTFLLKSSEWRLIKELSNPKQGVLERVVFKHKYQDTYIVADAYRGREIRQSTIDFLRFAAGVQDEVIDVGSDSKSIVLNAGGGADLIAYVGHDGLMDFALAEYPRKSGERRRDVIILACASKAYFAEAIRMAGANPLLWTTGLMAPEAYVLRSAIDGWIANEAREGIRKRGAAAYNSYQKCGMKAALNLFSTGW